MRNLRGTECSTDIEAFTRAAIAEVAKHDAARARAELLAAGDPADFGLWDDEVWAWLASVPSSRLSA